MINAQVLNNTNDKWTGNTKNDQSITVSMELTVQEAESRCKEVGVLRIPMLWINEIQFYMNKWSEDVVDIVGVRQLSKM